MRSVLLTWVIALGASLALLALGAPGPASAQGVSPGDLVVTDFSCCGGAGLIRVDRRTGAQTVISSGGMLLRPWGVAVAANGDIFVADALCCDSGPGTGRAAGVIRINPTTGSQSVVSRGANLFELRGIAIAGSGDLLVNSNGFDAVIRVNPTTGTQTVVAQGGNLGGPWGIAVASNGDFFVTSPQFRRVTRVIPATGAQTVVAEGGLLAAPEGLAVTATGDLFVADEACCGHGGVVRLNPATGAQTALTGSGNFTNPSDLTIAVTGELYVVDRDCCTPASPGGVVRVDPATGQQTAVTFGGNLVDPRAIAIVPGEPPPTPTVTGTPTRTPTPTATGTMTLTPARTVTPTATGTPTITMTPAVVSAQNPPPVSGQAGVPCTTQISGGCTIASSVSGRWTKTGSGTLLVSATGPANATPGGTPRVFVPTTAGVENFTCSTLPGAAPFFTTCAGTTAGDVLQGATITVRFPTLAAPGFADVTGTAFGPGLPAAAPLAFIGCLRGLGRDSGADSE
jgi:sugar lactone lactonase YvrE